MYLHASVLPVSSYIPSLASNVLHQLGLVPEAETLTGETILRA